MKLAYVLALGALGFASAASAQTPTGRPSSSATRPLGGGIGTGGSTTGFSPYLNLNRGGNSAAVNYYGIVRPQLNLQASIQGLQQQVAQAGQGMDDPTSPLVVGTRVRFLNTGGYFLNLSGGTSASTGAVGPRTGLAGAQVGGSIGGGTSFGGSGGNRGGTRGR